MDDDGLRVDLVEEASTGSAAEGRPPKLLYTIPNFHNPAGVTMSLERRERLIEIAHDRELLIVEDNPYGQIRFDGEPLQPLGARRRTGWVIYLSTFSKILAPGTRVGLGRGAGGGAAKMNLGKQAADLCSSTCQPALRDRVPAASRLARLRRAPQRHLPRPPRRDAAGARGGDAARATWTRPNGGLFVWATMPHIDTTTCWRSAPSTATRWRSCPAGARTSTAAAATR